MVMLTMIKPSLKSHDTFYLKLGSMAAERKELTVEVLKEEMNVTDEQLDLTVEEMDLPELAACFDNTEDYVEKLGLSPGEQTDVETKSFVRGIQAGMKKALKYWRSKYGCIATFRALIIMLLLLSKGNVAVAVCKYLSDKSSCTCQTQTRILTNAGLLSYGDYLKSRYRVLVSASSIQWPPLPTTEIFKLAMIQKDKIQRGKIEEDFVLLSITGKVDDILQRKIPVQLENIFCKATTGQRFVLIEGAPGSGKSTLALYICQEWAKGKLFKEYGVVVLVRLRDPNIRKARNIEDLLLCRNVTMAQEVAAEMTATDGRGVLWVLDGWDELPSDLPQDSIINKLISRERNSLHECALIVTSRPSSSIELHPLVSSRVEVLGFTPTELEHYFTECLNGNIQTVQTLLERIRENPVVEGSCCLPLNASIVAHVYLSGDNSLPTSNHGIFTSVVKFSLSRYMQDRLGMSSKQAVITGLDFLPRNVRNLFIKLCKLAYYGVIENKVTFLTDDFRAAGVSMKVCNLGLLQTVQSILVDGQESYFNFLHLSIQELLAAIHISKMYATDQMTVFKDLFGNPRFTAVFELYAGITKLKACRPFLSRLPGFILRHTPRGILDLVSRIVEKPQFVSLLRCLYEAEDTKLCELVASWLPGLFLSNTTLSPLDCLCIGYFLSFVHIPDCSRFVVNLKSCSISDHGCKFLCRGFSKHKPSHSYTPFELYFEDNDISKAGIHHIATLLKNTSAVCKLNLSNNESIDENGLEKLCEALSTTVMSDLDLSRCSIYDSPSLCQLLSTNKSLIYLNLLFNPLVDCRHLAAGLANNQHLKTLLLRGCLLTDQSMADLCTGLNNYIEHLDICGNPSLTENGMKTLADRLTTLSGIKVLKIPDHLLLTIHTVFREADEARVKNGLPKIAEEQPVTHYFHSIGCGFSTPVPESSSSITLTSEPRSLLDLHSN